MIQSATAIPSGVRERLDRHREHYAPRVHVPAVQWYRQHARSDEGRAFAHEAYPHLGAPGGPCDVLDDHRVRKIWLQFASRLGKTFLGQCELMRRVDINPAPLMFASADEKTAVEVVERTYAMMANSPKVAGQLRPPHQRRQSRMVFDACQCSVAWSRSISTLADKEVEFGHANEIDNWEQTSTSKQADPLKLFTDRFKNRPHHKAILESTPTIKRKSRIERGRLGSTNCSMFVPCPHCSRYQRLAMEHVKWEKLENGKSDKDLARRTARYVCPHCDGDIGDHHRPRMMQSGVWVPEGCEVDDERAAAAAESHEWDGWSSADWIVGTPKRDSTDAGYHLSSLYALSLSWGDIAAEFVACKSKPQDLRNFVNQWLADTWEHVKQHSTWEKLGVRIITPIERGVCPEWSSMLTIGVDRQESDGSRFPWAAVAWGPQDVHAVAYSEAEGFDEVRDIVRTQWQHADGGDPLASAFSVVDSGYRPDGVYEFCRQCHAQGLHVWPAKGSSQAMDCDYRRSVLGPNTSSPGMELILVDTIRTQLWLEDRIHSESSHLTIHAGSLLTHQDFLEQLLNDAPVDKLTASNQLRQSWQRINEHIPNDFRDCIRYAFVAMLIRTQGNIPARQQTARRPEAAQPTVTNSGRTTSPRW